ncbi:MAG: tetratricopeptide repeat protein [Cytophagaceae bacterium]
MKRFATSLIFSFLIFSTTAISAAGENWDYELSRIDKDFNGGEYKTALKKARTLVSKVSNTTAKQQLIAARAHFKLAKIYEMLGKFDEYHQNMESGFSAIAHSDKSDTLNYILALKDATESYIQYGEFAKAEKTIADALSLFEKLKPDNRGLELDLKEKNVQVLLGQGYLQKAKMQASELMEARKMRILKKEPVKDEKKGVYVEKKLTPKEILKRKRDYAVAGNLMAGIKMENGEYNSADSLLSKHSGWIKSNIKKKEITYVDALFIHGFLNEINNNMKGASKKYVKAVKLAGKAKDTKYKVYSRQTILQYERLVPALRAVGNKSKSKKRKKQLEARVKRYYGKNNFNYGKIQMMDAERIFMAGDIRKAEVKIKAILDNPAYFPEKHNERSKALNFLYQCNIEQDKYELAEENLNSIRNIKLALHGDKAPVYHFAKLDLANHHVLYSDKFQEAENIYNTSLQNVIEKEIGHKHPDYPEFLYQQSKLYEFTDRYEKAKTILEKAKNEVSVNFGEKNLKYAKALEKLANIEIHLGKYGEAEKELSRSVELFKTLGHNDDNLDYSHALETFARFYMLHGQYEEAERTLKKAYKLTKKAEENEKISSAGEELATLYILTGKYQATEKTLNEAIQIKEAKYGTDHRSLINPLNQLGHLYLITGDYTEAEKLVRRASALSTKIFGKNSIRNAESLKLLEKIYAAIGDYEKAEEAGIKVVEIQVSQYGRNHILVGNSLNDLALVKYYNGRSKSEVEDLFLESLKIIKQNIGDSNPQYAEVLTNLALFYFEIGKVSDAESNLEKANAIWIQKLGKQNIHTAEIFYLKGDVSYYKENYQEAKNNYQEAKNIYANIFDDHHPKYVKALSKTGQMAYIMGDNKTAVKHANETTENYISFIKKYFPSLSEREKNKYWNLIKNDFEFYNTLAVKLRNEYPDLLANVYNFNLHTKAILLSSSIKVKERIMASNNPSLISSYVQWVEKKEFLTSVLSMSLEQRKAEGIDIKILEKEIEMIEKDLSESSQIFANNYEKADYSWKKIKDVLKENEFAVEVFRFRWFDKKFTDSIVYAALVLSKESKKGPELVLFDNGLELESKFVNYYRNCIKFSVEDQYSYIKFWQPFNDIIKENSVVYFSPDGLFNQINLEAIRTPENDFLINKYEIVLVSNTKDLVIKKIEKERQAKLKVKPEVNRQVKLFGNPSYYKNLGGIFASADSTNSTVERTHKKDERVKPLPGAEKEVKNLVTLMKPSGWEPEIFINENATESKLKEIKDPRVLHIATHGFFLEDVKTSEVVGFSDKAIQNPLLRSGLLLANGGHLIANDNVYEFNSEDGVLTAYEAMNLNLDNTDLVVLSACETGLGEMKDVKMGEGVYGLQRSFLVAGANSVIMTLFKVNDDVTMELMNLFYSKWIATGKERKSFIEAKKEIMNKYNKPIYWGAFVMIGLE